MGTSVKIRKLKIKKLLQLVDSKNVAVPGFQRGYVWRVAQNKIGDGSLLVGEFGVFEKKEKMYNRAFNLKKTVNC